MSRRLSVLLTVAALAAASGMASAGTVSGPAGRLVLPDDITAVVRPANGNAEVSVVVALTQASSAASGPAALEMSCLPAFGRLAEKGGMERLSAATLKVETSLTLDKPGEWIEIDGLPAFHTDASRRDGTRLTQWMITRGNAIAWVKFDRPRGLPMEHGVLQAVSAMTVGCDASAAAAVRGEIARAASMHARAAKLALPEGVSVTEAAGLPELPGLAPSTVLTLTGAEPDAVPVTVAMTCERAVGRLEPMGTMKGIERMASMSYSANKTLKRERGSTWIKVGRLPVYRTRGVYEDGRRLTQWMMPLITAFVWIKFERPEGAPLEQTVTDAIEGMTVLCGPMAPSKGA